LVIDIDTGFATSGKKILLPVGLSRINYNEKRVYVDGLSKQQVEGLPEYNDRMTVDYDYEEQVWEFIALKFLLLKLALQLTTGIPNYHQEPSLYEMNEQAHQTLKLYEERLIANNASRQGK